MNKSQTKVMLRWPVQFHTLLCSKAGVIGSGVVGVGGRGLAGEKEFSKGD